MNHSWIELSLRGECQPEEAIASHMAEDCSPPCRIITMTGFLCFNISNCGFINDFYYKEDSF